MRSQKPPTGAPMGRWSQAKPSTPKRGRKKKRKASPATTAGQKQRISRGSHLTDGQWRSRSVARWPVRTRARAKTQINRRKRPLGKVFYGGGSRFSVIVHRVASSIIASVSSVGVTLSYDRLPPSPCHLPPAHDTATRPYPNGSSTLKGGAARYAQGAAGA